MKKGPQGRIPPMTRHRPTEPGIAGSSHVGVIVGTHCPRSRASPAGGRQTENLQVPGAPPLPSTFGHARRTALLRWARGGVALQIARCSSIPRHAKQLLSCRGNTPPPTRHQPGAQDGVALRGRELSLGLLRGRRKYYPQYYRGLARRFVLLQLSALLLAASSTRASGLILCWGRRVFSHCTGLVVGGGQTRFCFIISGYRDAMRPFAARFAAPFAGQVPGRVDRIVSLLKIRWTFSPL